MSGSMFPRRADQRRGASFQAATLAGLLLLLSRSPLAVAEDAGDQSPSDTSASPANSADHWLDAVRTQRQAWEARRAAGREAFERRRAARLERLDQKRDALLGPLPGSPPPPWPVFPPPFPPATLPPAPPGWDNHWYFQGF